METLSMTPDQISLAFEALVGKIHPHHLPDQLLDLEPLQWRMLALMLAEFLLEKAKARLQ